MVALSLSSSPYGATDVHESEVLSFMSVRTDAGLDTAVPLTRGKYLPHQYLEMQ